MGMEATFTFPAPQPRKRGLLVNAATPIPGAERWGAGVTGVTFGCDTGVRVVDNFCDYNTSVINTDLTRQTPIWAAFHVFINEACSTIGLDYDWLTGRITGRLAAHASFHLAKDLLSSIVPANPDFVGEADSVGTGLSIQKAMAAVESALAKRLYGAQGIIHVAPSALQYLDYETTDNADGPSIFTATGHKVVADAGYEPTDYTAGIIYGSGPVYLNYSPPRAIGVEGNQVVLTTNKTRAQSVMDAVLAFDPCPVVSATYTIS